ncbi:hypothetical protein JCM10295v2_002797 [Rhodotorula toruloides]
MLDPIRRAKDRQVARVGSVPLEDLAGRGRRRERLAKDKERQFATAGGLSSVRRQSRVRRGDAREAIDLRAGREEEVEAMLGQGVDFEAFRQATQTQQEYCVRAPTRHIDSFARQRPLSFPPPSSPPTIGALSPPISPSFARPAQPNGFFELSQDEEDDTPSSFWSPEYQTALHLAHFGAGGRALPSAHPAPIAISSQHPARQPRRISYDVPEEREAWTAAQGIVDEALGAPRVALALSIAQTQYRQSVVWNDEGSDLHARRKDAAAKRLEMVAQQLSWA